MPGQQRAAADRHRADPVDDAARHIGVHVDRRRPTAGRDRHEEDAGHQEVNVRRTAGRVTQAVADWSAENVIEEQQHDDRHHDGAHEEQREPLGVLELPPDHRSGVVDGEGQRSH